MSSVLPAGGSGAGEPSVSAVLLCYNCVKFVADAVQSALDQDYDGPLEILVSDDASTDGTFERARTTIERYRGRHDVALDRRATNSGSKSAHLNDVFGRCRGDIVVSFDGDDIAEPNRLRTLVQRFKANRALQAAYSTYSLIDAEGRPLGAGFVPHPPRGAAADEWFARVDAYASGATLAVRREVIEAFGLLPPDIHEDVVLPFRASLLGEVEFIDAPLVKVRRHDGSLTADWQRFESIEQYRARLRRGIDKARHAALSRLDDLRAAARMMPEHADRFGRLERAVHDSLSHAELTAPLLSPSWVERVRTLARLVRAGAYRRELPQHVSLALAPSLYLRYKRRRLGIDSTE